ncbi:MAG: TolC family protein [Gemmatimonadaceae bacterium]
MSLVLVARPIVAQTPISKPPGSARETPNYAGETGELAELLRLATSANPSISAARSRVAAARARVGPAAAWPDPMLMAGIENLPLGSMKSAPSHLAEPSVPGDAMTMKMIGVEQTIPFPGKPSLRRRIAEREVDAALAVVEMSVLEIIRDVKRSYFELAYIDQALGIVNRSQAVLGDIVRVAEVQYASGASGQQDVLKARVEAARLGEIASALFEQRRAAVAELNALLDRTSATPIDAKIPDRITEAAIDRDPTTIRFVTQTLGSRTANSPFPSLEALQDAAVRGNYAIKEREAMIAAQSARVELARKASRPDIDFSLQYGQRDQRPDMISAVVSIPLPVHKRSRQDQELAEARSELAAMQSDLRATANKVRSEVARMVSDLERNRTQLALYTKAILPQGQAAVTSSLASYQSGKADLLAVLDNQSTLFAYETAYYRALTDFARTLADLEQIVGGEVLR